MHGNSLSATKSIPLDLNESILKKSAPKQTMCIVLLVFCFCKKITLIWLTEKILVVLLLQRYSLLLSGSIGLCILIQLYFFHQVLEQYEYLLYQDLGPTWL